MEEKTKKPSQEEEDVVNKINDIDNVDNFEPLKKSCGSLFKTRDKTPHMMKIPEQKFFDIEKNEVLLVLHGFRNKVTDERVFIFLYNESKYMYITDDIEKEFEKVHTGSTEQKYENKK